MSINKAFERIFLGYAMIFLDFNIFIDIVPDILGYHLIATGWREVADSGLTGLTEETRRGAFLLARFLMVLSIFAEIYKLLGGGSTGGGWFDVTVPETPPIFQLRLASIASLLLFLSGVWLMAQILTASRNMAEGEGKITVVRGLERSLELLKKVYTPIGVTIVLMEQCISLPNVWWGNLIHGFQELGTLMYFCFQLMLVLQIANLRKNLDCCKEIEAVE